ELAATNGHTPSVPDVAAAMGSPLAAVTSALGVPTAPVSLDAPIGDALTLENVVTDPAAPDPEVETLAHEETSLVSQAVRRLPPRQRYVIARHFGLDDDAAPFSRIAADLRVSPERVRAIERVALRDLAAELEPLCHR